MSSYQLFTSNYLIFDQLNADSVGTNYRAGFLKDRKTDAHAIITQVHPYLTTNEKTWKRIKLLLEGINKSHITHLYSPEKIVQGQDKIALIYPFLKGRTLEQILQDSENHHTPINFDLAFSIAMSIADIIEIGSSIVISGKKSFHGLLTPDNIIIDFDGNIFLKNYGIIPYLDINENILGELKTKYSNWLTPELDGSAPLTHQADIYHLGYILFRMITGSCFTVEEGETFDSAIEKISFADYVPDVDANIQNGMLSFFKKTLNPDPSARFASIKEFKDYISNVFHIEELSSITFNLAYFINSIYSKTIEELEATLETERNFEIPEEKPDEPAPANAPVPAPASNDMLVEDILTGLDKSSGGSGKLFGIIGAVIIIAAAVIYFVVQNQNQKYEEAQKKLQDEKRQSEIRQAEEEKRRQAAAAETQRLLEEQKNRMDSLQKELQDAKTAEQKKQAKKRLEEEQKKQEQEKADQLKKQQEEADRVAREEAQKKEDQFNTNFNAAKTAFAAKDYAKAKTHIATAKEVKDTEELAALLKQIDEMEKLESAIKNNEIIDIKYATKQPVKLTGTISRSILKKINASNAKVLILIDDTGTVNKIRFTGSIEAELKMKIMQSLNEWTYSPAERDGKKLKVWYTEKFENVE